MDLDSCKRPRDLQAYLLVLANHCPPVALLRCGERVQQADAPSLLQNGAPVPRACPATVFYDVVQSETDGEFSLGNGGAVRLGETPGFERRLRVDQFSVVVVSSTDVDREQRFVWIPLHDVDRTCERGPALRQALGHFFADIPKLFVPAATEGFRSMWQTTQLQPDQLALGHVVPDLNQYVENQGALILQFDCATQKYRQIIKLVKEHLRFHPMMRIVFVSCRVVHAIDLFNDLTRAFPEGCGTEFSCYNKPDISHPTRLVVQLNSLPCVGRRTSSLYWTRSVASCHSSPKTTGRCGTPAGARHCSSTGRA